MERMESLAMVEKLSAIQLYYWSVALPKNDLDSLLVPYQATIAQRIDICLGNGVSAFGDFIRSLKDSLKRYIVRLYTLVLLKSKRNDLETVVLLLLISISSTYVATIHLADIGYMYVKYIVPGTSQSRNVCTDVTIMIQELSFLKSEAYIVREYKNLRRLILANTLVKGVEY